MQETSKKIASLCRPLNLKLMPPVRLTQSNSFSTNATAFVNIVRVMLFHPMLIIPFGD